MTTQTLAMTVNDVLAQKRIVVSGVSRDDSRHPSANLIYCRQHGISVIAGACPMMAGPGTDLGHTCMRWVMKLTGGLPA